MDHSLPLDNAGQKKSRAGGSAFFSKRRRALLRAFGGFQVSVLGACVLGGSALPFAHVSFDFAREISRVGPFSILSVEDEEIESRGGGRLFGIPVFELERFSVVPSPFAFLKLVGAPEPNQVVFGKPANEFVFLFACDDYELSPDVVAGKFGFPPSAVGVEESLVVIAAESDGVFGRFDLVGESRVRESKCKNGCEYEIEFIHRYNKLIGESIGFATSFRFLRTISSRSFSGLYLD